MATAADLVQVPSQVTIAPRAREIRPAEVYPGNNTETWRRFNPPGGRRRGFR